MAHRARDAETGLRSKKAMVRSQVAHGIARVSPRERRDAAAGLCTWFRRAYHDRLPAFVVYGALENEVNTWPLIESVWSAGGAVGLPRVEHRSMQFFTAYGYSDLTPGVFGILEPKAGLHPVEPAETELAIVPGRAFSATGERTGRGGGYYDRFLAGLPTTTRTVGVCFACQVLDEVPVGAHDRGVQEVLILPEQRG